MRTSLAQTPASAAPSAWVQRFAGLIPQSGEVLDLACGGGRHARWLAARGYRVEAVDRDAAALAELTGVRGVHPRQADLEQAYWPYEGRQFSGIVVTNYLFRPQLESLLAALADPGVLLYETFLVGHQVYGKPSRADFLLRSQEMLGWASARGWRVIAFEEGVVDSPRRAAVQRLCAARGAIEARL